MEQQIISQLREYAQSVGKSPSTICREAGLGSTFIERLEDGGSCRLPTLEKINAFIAANPPAPTVEQNGAAA